MYYLILEPRKDATVPRKWVFGGDGDRNMNQACIHPSLLGCVCTSAPGCPCCLAQRAQAVLDKGTAEQ